MSYLLFMLPIAGLLAIIALRTPGKTTASESAFSYASENA